MVMGKMFQRGRRNQNDAPLEGGKFQFLRSKGGLVFLFGFFGGSDGFAQRTGMLAVKGHGHGGTKGTGLEIVGQHGCPGDCLQQRPMCADGGHERENDQNLA